MPGRHTSGRCRTVLYFQYYAKKWSVAYLAPFRDECLVGVLLVDAELVEFPRDGLAPVVEVEDESAALVRDLEDGPQGLALALALVRLVLGCTGQAERRGVRGDEMGQHEMRGDERG